MSYNDPEPDPDLIPEDKPDPFHLPDPLDIPKPINRLVQYQFNDFPMALRVAIVNERLRIVIEYKRRFQKNKKEIREELLRMGIEVKRGSHLSKLLRVDYLPVCE